MLGVVAILIGVALPALGSARRSADVVRSLAQMRSNVQLIDLYLDMSRDVYPVEAGKPAVHGFTQYWFVMLGRAGLVSADLAAARDTVDVFWDRRQPSVPSTIWMSAAMVSSVEDMTPGSTKPLDRWQTSVVRRGDVRFPSDKGLLYEDSIYYGRPIQVTWGLASGPWPEGSIAMADGSVERGIMPEYLPQGVFYREFDVGNPILSTWYGAHGRDRRSAPSPRSGP